ERGFVQRFIAFLGGVEPPAVEGRWNEAVEDPPHVAGFTVGINDDDVAHALRRVGHDAPGHADGLIVRVRDVPNGHLFVRAGGPQLSDVRDRHGRRTGREIRGRGDARAGGQGRGRDPRGHYGRSQSPKEIRKNHSSSPPSYVTARRLRVL